MISYFEKSTGVFNGDGVISDDELAAIQKRAAAPKNLWHGFISLDEEHSEKIDESEKCIQLIKSTFGEFFKDMGLEPNNVDLICSLHKDRPTHLHIHFWFAEKEPKCKYRKKETEYRHKGKIEQSVIDKMHERLNEYIKGNHPCYSHRIAVKELKALSVNNKIVTAADIEKELIALAKDIPNGAHLSYNSDDMEPYRKRIDKIVNDILLYDKAARKAKLKFSERLGEVQLGEVQLGEVQRKAEGIEFLPHALLDVSKETYRRIHSTDEKNLAILDNVEKEYRSRQGDLVLHAIKFIKPELYVTKRKHKVNDKKLKRSLAISDRKVKSRIGSFLLSFAQACEGLSQTACNRLQEIEAEIEENHKREQEQDAAASKPRYGWSK